MGRQERRSHKSIRHLTLQERTFVFYLKVCFLLQFFPPIQAPNKMYYYEGSRHCRFLSNDLRRYINLTVVIAVACVGRIRKLM